jgi:hypothetical protein
LYNCYVTSFMTTFSHTQIIFLLYLSIVLIFVSISIFSLKIYGCPQGRMHVGPCADPFPYFVFDFLGILPIHCPPPRVQQLYV